MGQVDTRVGARPMDDHLYEQEKAAELAHNRDADAQVAQGRREYEQRVQKEQG
jgi:hypothetical protein